MLGHGLIVPARKRIGEEPEWMDLPDRDPAVLAGCLKDLARLNRLFGGIRLTVEALEDLSGNLLPGSELEILDIATGGGDFPRAMADWAKRRGLRARVLATDLDPEMLELAARGGDAGGTVEFAAADARRLPFADESFDVVTCSLTLHHFDPEEAVVVLKEMCRVARVGVIVNDLVRSRCGIWAAWLASRAVSRNPFIRHDAPLSVSRAYTKREMAALAARTGMGPVRFRGALGYRAVMVAGGTR